MLPFRKVIPAALIASGLASCADRLALTAPVIRTVEAARITPEEAKKPCAAPVIIPDVPEGQFLPARQVTSLWARDRVSLRVCEKRRALAVNSDIPVPPTRPFEESPQ